MAVHDYVISNGTGSAVRSDINGALAAIVSQNSNASAPATTYAYMSWADTTAGVMKMRNGANSAWISLYELDGTFLASDISLAAGSAAAPSLFFTGDTNTGLFSPGADTVALATAGSNRLHITSGGLVGIGTTGPVVALDVVGQVNSTAGYASNRFAVNTSPLSTTSTAQSFARFTSTGGDFYVGIESSTAGAFFSGSTAYAACLYNSASTPLQFFTGGAIRATLNSTGLGIGTTSPGSLLDVAGEIRIYPASGDANLRFGSGGVEKGRIAVNSSSNCIIETAGSERLRIDSSGRLLVGTSSARTNIDYALGTTGSQLQIEQANAITNFSIVQNFDSATTGAPATFTLARSGATSLGSTTIVANNNRVGEINFSGSDGTDFTVAACIRGEVDGTPGANDMPGRLVFSTTADGAASPTERMRINSRGAFKASNTGTYSSPSGPYHEFYQSTDTAGLYIRGTNASQTATILEVNGDRTTTNSTYFLIDAYNGNFSGRFIVRDSGNAVNTNNSYGAISDAKLKENIVDANSQWDDLKALQVRNYNFKEGQTHTQIGLVAQEVELVSPGLVSESPDRDKEGNDLGTVTKSVNYSVLYMKAVKALQEAMERIEALEADVAALKGA